MSAWRRWFGVNEARDIHRAGDVLLRRRTLLRTPWFTLKLHRFERADPDCLHDHPWAFASLILRHGYFETQVDRDGETRRHWRSAGSLLLRPALHRHRVEPYPGERPLTLVVTLRRCREWGFWTPTGWVRWQLYDDRNEAC